MAICLSISAQEMRCEIIIHKDQNKYRFNNTGGQKSIIGVIDYTITVLDIRVLTSANIGTYLINHKKCNSISKNMI